MEQAECKMYKKHHNIIDGVYTLRLPQTWEEIPPIDEIDSIDEDGELHRLFLDAKIYNIEDLDGFELPTDNHNIDETIFIIRRNGYYYLCETQGEKYIKYSTNISNIGFVTLYDRMSKINKIQDVIIHKRISGSV